MFSAHPTTDPGTIFSPKPTKKHTSEPTLKIHYLKLGKNKKTAKKRLPTGSQNPLKIIKTPTLEPKLSPLVLLSTPQPPTGDQRSKKQVPNVANYVLKLKKSDPHQQLAVQKVIHISSQPVQHTSI